MLPLGGRRIALLERRHRDEFATLVHKLGGEPVSAPAMDEVACHDDFNAFMDGLIGHRFSLAVFLSGAGVATLLVEADRRGRLSEAVAALRQLSIACRGAKPQAALKRHGLKTQITTARPHTTRELLRALASTDVAARGIVLVHHGERNIAVADDLLRRGARLKEVCPYTWGLPDDVEPVTGVIRDAIAHRLDAVLFTNQVQCRHLFHIAADMNLARGLALSLNRDVVVGAVGAVCARGLSEMGVTADVIPSAANMPALVSAVATYFEAHGAGTSS
jgi:uroporphyrinogen-III synthase